MGSISSLIHYVILVFNEVTMLIVLVDWMLVDWADNPGENLTRTLESDFTENFNEMTLV